MNDNPENSDLTLEVLLDEIGGLALPGGRKEERLELLFQHGSLLALIEEALREFTSRLRSIEQLLKDVKRDLGPFIYGHLYSAVIGAYEAFMHDTLDALSESDILFERARDCVVGPKSHDDNHIKIKRKNKFRDSPSKQAFRELLHSATLMDAQKVAATVKSWFHIDFPVLEDMQEVASRRNLLSHNGAKYLDGSVEHVTEGEILVLVDRLGRLAANTAVQIEAKIDEFTDGAFL